MKKPMKSKTPVGSDALFSSFGKAVNDVLCRQQATGISAQEIETLARNVLGERIVKLSNVLRHTVGLMDALRMIEGLPSFAPSRKGFAGCREQIADLLNEQMPEWNAVCKAIHEENARAVTPATETEHGK